MGFISGFVGRFAIGAGLALLAAIAFLWFQLSATQDRLTQAHEDRRVALAANAANAETIAALQERIRRDSTLLRELRGLREQVASAADERRNGLEQIANENPDARAFLNLPIPDSLRHAASGDADADNPPQD